MLIERTPTASSRRRSHSGDGPTVTPRITAAWNRGHDAASSIADAEAADGVGSAGVPGRRDVEALGAGNRRQPERRARTTPTSSRATPLWPSRSGRFGVDVHDQAVVGERHRVQERRPRRGVGGELEDAVVLLAQAQLARAAEHALGDLAPELGLLELHRAPPLPCGTVAPTGANGYFLPAVTLGAPHTTLSRALGAVVHAS